MGYSKMLPQIALGHSQSAIINTAYFENQVLHLSEIMIPPLMSSTLRSEDVLGPKEGAEEGADKGANVQAKGASKKEVQEAMGETKEAGRPEKPDDQKSDKTI